MADSSWFWIFATFFFFIVSAIELAWILFSNKIISGLNETPLQEIKKPEAKDFEINFDDEENKQ